MALNLLVSYKSLNSSSLVITMKFKINQEILKNYTSLLSSASPSTTVMEVLKGTLIRYIDGRIHMICSDIDAELSISFTPIDCENPQTKGVVVFTDKLCSITKTLTGDVCFDVNYDADPPTITISQQRSKFVLHSLIAEDFPLMCREEDNLHSVSIKTETLKSALSSILGAIALSNFRPFLLGGYIEFKDGTLSCVGTDAFRMNVYQTKDFDYQGDNVSGIIPRKSITLLLKALALGISQGSMQRSDYTVLIRLSKQGFSFKLSDDITINGKFIDDKFPEWCDSTPKPTTCVSMEMAAFKKALLSSLILAKNPPIATFKFTKHTDDDDATLEITSQNMYGEQSSILMEIAKTSGKSFKVSYNTKFILSAIQEKILEAKNINFSASSNAACIIAADGNNPYSVIHNVVI